MKLKKIRCIVICIVAMCITACQPTPEKEAVIPKDNTEKMVIEAAKNEQENEAEATEKPSFQYETPNHISERFSIVEGALDILIDADVIMPEMESVPVAKIKSSPFTQERADKLREYFMKDGKLVTQYVRTKADYDAMIIEAKRGHEVDGEMVFDESSQQWVDQLLKEREKAPDEDVANIITDYSINGEEELSGRIIINGEEKGSLSIDEKHFSFYNDKTFRVDKNNRYDDDGNLVEWPTVEINITEEEAINTAQRFLHELGIEGMDVKEIYKSYYFSGDDIKAEPEYGGYYIVFMRKFGNMMPINIEGYGMGQEDKFEVSPPARAEKIIMGIDDNGSISSFNWSDPIEILEVLAEHVEILPFEDIMTRLKDFSKIQWAYVGEHPGDIKMIKKINKIELSLNYLPIKNNATEFMYAPCWTFMYKDLREYTEEQLADMKQRGMWMPHEDEMGDNFLIFSAVDGASVSAYTSEEWERYQRRRQEREDG